MADGFAGTDDTAPRPAVMARRRFLQVAGLSGVAAAAAPLLARPAGASVVSGPGLLRQPDRAGAPVADQLHLTFGTDPARSMVASWSTPCPGPAPGSAARDPGRRLRADGAG
jgi:hypothetical protein